MKLHQPRGRRSRVQLVLLSVLGILGALALTQAPATANTLPKPTSITVAASTDPALALSLAGAPDAAKPDVFAGPGTPVLLTVSLWADGAPAAYPNDQLVSFSAPGPGVLTLLSANATFPAGETTATFKVSYSEGTPALQVTAAIGKGKSALTAATQTFRVENVLQILDGQNQDLLNGTAGADGNGCAVVDKDHPVCGVVSLPAGATGSVGLSLGACPVGETCSGNALVTQLIGNLNSTQLDQNGQPIPLYSSTAPATMTIICDKSICGQGGVTKFTALWSQSATGALQESPACPAKGTIDQNQTYCTDYVSSTRDNAGDLHLVVLFLQDVRGTI